MMSVFRVLLVMVLSIVLMCEAAFAANRKTPPSLLEGQASWYGEFFQGRPTASGELFDMNGLTAAHMTLPLGSIVRVVNLENGKTVIVRINDRGPFKRQFIIDLSRKAAGDLGMLDKGTATVRIEPMDRSVIAGASPEAVAPAVIKEAYENATASRNINAPKKEAKEPVATVQAGTKATVRSEQLGEVTPKHNNGTQVVAVAKEKQKESVSAPASPSVAVQKAPSSSVAPKVEPKAQNVAADPAGQSAVATARVAQKGQQAPKNAQSLVVGSAERTATADNITGKNAHPTSADGAIRAALDSGYYVQTGAFSKRKNAENYVVALRKAGFVKSSWYRKAPSDNLWIVSVGPFDTKQEANNRLAALKNAGHNGFVKLVSK